MKFYNIKKNFFKMKSLFYFLIKSISQKGISQKGIYLYPRKGYIFKALQSTLHFLIADSSWNHAWMLSLSFGEQLQDHMLKDCVFSFSCSVIKAL